MPSERWPVVHDQLDVDRRDLVEAQDRVVVPGEGGDPPTRQPHLLLQRPAGGHDHAALELVLRAVRIDHLAAVGDAPHVVEPHLGLDGQRDGRGDVGPRSR